jgi:chromosome segregation ATPase
VTIFRRILAAIVMAISALMLLASLAGIAGAWIMRAQLATSLLGVVTAAESRVATMEQGLGQLDTALNRARDQVTAIERQVQSLGADAEENRPLVTAISDALGLDLAPLVERARDLVTTMRETTAALNGTIEAINAIPFVSVPVPEMERLNKLSQDVEDFTTAVQEVRTAVDERRSEVIEGTVALITGPITRIGGSLDDAQAVVSGYRQRLGAIQDGLVALKRAIRRALTASAVGVTLVMLWIALSQAGLMVHGWRFYSGRDPLARTQEAVPHDG